MTARATARSPRRLTVLFVDTGTGWRGGQRQVFWLVQRMARLGHRPILALRPGAPLAVRAAEIGLEVVPISPTLSEAGPWTVMRLRRLIGREHVDVVHPQTSHAIGLAALATVGTRARLVIARRVTFPLRGNVGTRWKYGRADAVIAVCRAAVPGLLEGGVDPERVEVIPSGVDLSRRVTPASRETLATFGVPEGAPLVVMVAAIAPMKDPLTFVRALAAARRSVPALHALLVGDGPLRSEVEAAVRELGLEGAFHLTGFRSDADAFLAAADVVALSSAAVGEGIAGVLIDAISFGKPVAATRGGGIPEVVEDGVSGFLVPVGDAEALGAAIARLAGDRELAARMGAAGLARAPEFSIERTVERTLAVYERLARR